jgi:3-hydroxyacyl-[acyl-carrier-protein] dehydratase
MRFLLFDRIDAAEPGSRIEAVKLVSLTDNALADHYPRRAVLPATLVVESMAQLGGMLHVLTHDFAVEMLLVLVDDVTLHRPVLHGETMTIEVRTERDHPYGATMKGEARVEDELIAAAGRIVYAHEHVTDPKKIKTARDRFTYQAGAAVAALTQ